MPNLKKKELFDSSPRKVKCSWCRKDIELGALCCPYCNHDGPAAPWENNPKHFSFILHPEKIHKAWTLHFELRVAWVDSCGQQCYRTFTASLNGKVLNTSIEYLMEIDVPENSQITVYMDKLCPGSGDDFDTTIGYSPKNGQWPVLSSPGKYKVEMYKEAYKRFLITHYKTVFSVDRIG